MKKKLVIAFCILFACAAGLRAQDTQQRINKKNLIIKEWNSDPRGGNRTLDHVTTYSPEGKKIEEIEYNSDGIKWIKRYEYNADGKVSKELVYDSRRRLQTYKTFEYNEFGRKKVQYTYNARGRLIQVKNYEYIAQDAS